MNLSEYFKTHEGFGVLSTADKKGVVNSALFARPHIEGDRALFISVDRQNLANLRENPSAAFLFQAAGEGYEGVRLSLKLSEISEDEARIKPLLRTHAREDVKRFLLVFEILSTRPLVGSGED
jgi:hypothetical protein